MTKKRETKEKGGGKKQSQRGKIEEEHRLRPVTVKSLL